MTSTHNSTGTDNVIPFPGNGNDEVEASVATMRLALEGWMPPTNEQWIGKVNPICPTLRMAWLTVVRHGPADCRQVATADQEFIKEMMRQFAWTIDYFDKLSLLCEVAMERLIAHGAPEPECDWLEPAVDARPSSPDDAG